MNKLLVSLTTVALMATSALPALAWGNDIEVENSNKACVENIVTVGANTGSNIAAGGWGGDGGDTGRTRAYDGSIATGGNANGGNGGSNSGDITTGDAYAKAKVVNVVNTNKTKIKATCASCPDVDDVEVENRNRAHIDNDVLVGADTGMNEALGGDGGIGGDTGSTKAYGGSVATGGNANGGNGASNSGDIDTGDAYAKAKVVNIVNKNLTRIRR